MVNYFCYITDAPDAPGMTDYQCGSTGKYFYQGSSLKAAISGMKKIRGKKPFKVFSYKNIYDDSSQSLVHVES